MHSNVISNWNGSLKVASVGFKTCTAYRAKRNYSQQIKKTTYGGCYFRMCVQTEHKCSLCRSSAYLHIVDHHYCHLAVTRAPIPTQTLLLLLLPPRPLLQLRLKLFATGARSGARYFLSGGMGDWWRESFLSLVACRTFANSWCR